MQAEATSTDGGYGTRGTSVWQGPARWILARSNYMDVVLSDGDGAGKRGKWMAKNVHTAGQDYTGVQCWSEECATGVF